MTHKLTKPSILIALLLTCVACLDATINHNPWVEGEGEDVLDIVLTLTEQDNPDNSATLPAGSTPGPLDVSLDCTTSCRMFVYVSYNVTADSGPLSTYVYAQFKGQNKGTSGTLVIPRSDFETGSSVTVQLIGEKDDGSTVNLGSIDIEASCGSASGNNLRSISSFFPVGTSKTGLTSGNLSIHSERINPEVYFPYYLERGFHDGDYNAVYSDEISGGRFVLTDYDEPSELYAPDAANVGVATPSLSGGDYFFWLRMKGSDAGGDSIWFDYGEGGDEVARAPSDQAWSWVRLNESAIGLDAGIRNLDFKLRDTGVGMDALIVTSDAAFVPSGSVPELPASGESHRVEIESGQFDPVFFDALDEEAEATGQLSGIFAGVDPATYDLWLHVRSVDGSRLRLFWDEAVTGDEVVFGENASWTWIKVQSYVTVSNSGDYDLDLELPDVGVDIDALILTDDTSLAPSGVTQPPSDPGTFWVEAENMTASAEMETVSGQDPLEVSNEAYVFKTQYFSDNAALKFRSDLSANRTVDVFPHLRFALDFESNGQHYMWVRARIPFSGRNSMWLTAATGDAADREDVPVHFETAGTGWEWLRIDDSVLDFSGGGQRHLALRFREGGVHVDRVLVTTDENYTPVDPGDVPAGGVYDAFEAEKAGVVAPFRARFSIRQIHGSDTLVDIVALASPEQGYRMDRYFIDADAEPDSTTGLYDITGLGDPYASVTVSNPDPYDHATGSGSYDQLEVDRSNGNVALYTYDPLIEDWTLTEGGGLREEFLEERLSPDGDTRTELLTIRAADGSVIEQYAEIYRMYAFGERLIRRVRHPESITLQNDGTLAYGAGDPIVDEWEYYEEGLGRVGRLNYRLGNDGGWTTYEYDERGRTTRVVSQFLDSEFDDSANSRVVTYDFSDPGVDETGDVRVTTRVETLAGVEVARRYTIDVRDASGHRIKLRNIVATVQGASWNTASNLETVTTYTDPGGAFPGLVARITRPDGTVTTSDYAFATEAFLFVSESGPVSIDGILTVERTGAVDSSGAVVDGRETESFRSIASGTTLRRVTTDVATGLELDRMDVLDVDGFGRVVLTGHGDGSTTEREYAAQDCGCGPDSLKSETDRQGITTTYGYDALGRRTSMTRLGVTETYELDAQGRTIRITRSSGSETQIVAETDYDLAGRLTERRVPGSVIDGSLVATTTGYAFPSEGGQVVTTTHPDDSTEIRTTYPDGQTKTTFGTAAAPMKMAYGTFTEGTDSGLFTRQIRLLDDPQTPGNYLETEWTESRTVMGRQHSTVFPDGAAQTVAYDDKGRVIEQIDPDGVTTCFEYDNRGRRTVTAVKTANTTGIDYANDRITEQEFAIIQKTIDLGEGQPELYTFQQTRSYVYDNENDATSKVLVSTSEREVFGRGSLQTDASGAESRSYRTLAVGGNWNEVSVAPSGAYTERSYLGGLLDAVTAFDADNTQLAQTTYGYDHFNRQSSVADSRTGTTSLAYYDNNQVQEIIAPDPSGGTSTLSTLMAYDTRGREIERTLPDGSTVYSEYNDRGQLTKTYGSQQNPVEYTYDAQGRQLTMTTWQDFNENTGTGISGDATTTWIYNPQRGWLDRKEYEDGEGTDYTYTPGGRLASRTWARGIATNYAYNLAGDLTAVHYDDGQDTPDVRYTYTRSGQQSVVEDGQFATAAFSAGDILSTVPALDTTRYTYDYSYTSEFLMETETVSGLLTADAVLTRTYQDGTETNGLLGRAKGYDLSTDGGQTSASAATYGYDTAGRLKTVADDTATFTYGYLANTRNLLETMTGPVHTTTYSYEPGRNAMTGIENKETVGTDSVVSNYAYTYNELGQRETREQSYDDAATVHMDTFEYDYLGQIDFVQNDVYDGDSKYEPDYNFDEIGNRTGNTADINGTTSYTQDLLNQYTAVGSKSPEYDSDGNLTDDGTWTYTWNGENRLATATNNTLLLEFTYDYQGRLIRQLEKTENQTTGNWETDDEVVYLYDGWNRIAKYHLHTSSFTLQTSYLWGMDLSGSMQGAGGVGGLLKEGNRYPTYDANGNIVQKLDSNGDTDMAVEYDPFGNVINVVSGSFVGDYGFSTKPLIDGIEMYYYGFRYYDPVTGRWPSRDSIQEEGGLNLYGLVGNGAVNLVDYLGMMVQMNAQSLHLYDSNNFFILISTQGDETEITGISSSAGSFSGKNPRYEGINEPFSLVSGSTREIAIAANSLIVTVKGKYKGCPFEYKFTFYTEGGGSWDEAKYCKGYPPLNITSSVHSRPDKLYPNATQLDVSGPPNVTQTCSIHID